MADVGVAVAVQVARGAVQDEEHPRQLVKALQHNVLGHGAREQVCVTSVWFFLQEIEAGALGGQCCGVDEVTALCVCVARTNQATQRRPSPS